MPVKELETLRRALRTAGGDYKVYKNTLVLRAIREAGLEVLEPLLTGPTAIAFVNGDVAAVAKVLRDFARTNPNLIVKGGLVGTDLIDARSATALAELPSRDQLLAQIAGLFAAPLQQFAGLLKALPQKFAYGLSALIEQQGGVARRPTTPSSTSAPLPRQRRRRGSRCRAASCRRRRELPRRPRAGRSRRDAERAEPRRQPPRLPATEAEAERRGAEAAESRGQPRGRPRSPSAAGRARPQPADEAAAEAEPTPDGERRRDA